MDWQTGSMIGSIIGTIGAVLIGQYLGRRYVTPALKRCFGKQ